MDLGANPLVMISYGIGILGMVGGAFSFIRYSNYKATVQLQNDNIKALQDKVGILEDQLNMSRSANIEATKSISNLEGKLEAYKDIPLHDIKESLSSLADSNKEILSTLKKSVSIVPQGKSEDGLTLKTREGQTATLKVTNRANIV